ncbi:MAG: biopolymer transporter ExbD [bacterium]|nr:MAG: biopolymer transporter ExbD [bacterium]
MGYAPTKRRAQRRKRPSLLVLNITSMLDMFTILILFLLKSYSTEGMILTIPADLHLPYSSTETVPEPGLVIELTENVLVVDGVKLAVDLREAENGDFLIIPELFEHLSEKVRRYEAIASVNPDAAFTGQMILEGDRNIPFRLLKKILYTSGQAGFINQSLAVFQKE